MLDGAADGRVGAFDAEPEVVAINRLDIALANPDRDPRRQVMTARNCTASISTCFGRNAASHRRSAAFGGQP